MLKWTFANVLKIRDDYVIFLSASAFSVGFGLFDYVTDIIVAIEWLIEKRYEWFGLLLAILICTNGMTTHLIKTTFQKSQFQLTKWQIGLACLGFSRVLFFHILVKMRRVFGGNRGNRSDRNDRLYRYFLRLNMRFARLRINETYVESFASGFITLYVIITQNSYSIFTILSVIASTLALGNSVTKWIRIVLAVQHAIKLPIIYIGLSIVYHGVDFLARISSIILFISYVLLCFVIFFCC